MFCVYFGDQLITTIEASHLIVAVGELEMRFDSYLLTHLFVFIEYKSIDLIGSIIVITTSS